MCSLSLHTDGIIGDKSTHIISNAFPIAAYYPPEKIAYAYCSVLKLNALYIIFIFIFSGIPRIFWVETKQRKKIKEKCVH